MLQKHESRDGGMVGGVEGGVTSEVAEAKGGVDMLEMLRDAIRTPWLVDLSRLAR